MLSPEIVSSTTWFHCMDTSVLAAPCRVTVACACDRRAEPVGRLRRERIVAVGDRNVGELEDAIGARQASARR